MPEEPTAAARFRAELTGAWAEFLASLFFVFFGAGSVCGAVKAVGEPVVVEPINYAASFGFEYCHRTIVVRCSDSSRVGFTHYSCPAPASRYPECGET